MTTKDRTAVAEPRRTKVRPHRLGMGWHYLWEYDPPIEHRIQHADGTMHDWQETGETSEGCIMWLADQFAIQKLGTTAQEIYALAYEEKDDEEFDDDWVATDVLRDAWGPYTVLPKCWTPGQVRKLFEDLEDVNYHSFLGEMMKLIEQRLPPLAARLDGWCKPAPTPSDLPLQLKKPA